MRTAIIGAGAAGCFCAINIKRLHRDCDVEIFESGTHPLAKVAVTGGGRCNLTNSFRNITNLSEAYPRGDKLMRRALSVFSHEDTMDWFEREGVALVTQDDECVFPQSQDAMEIVNTLTRLCRREGVTIHLRSRVNIEKVDDGFMVGNKLFDRVVVTVGGCPKASRLDFLSSLDLAIVPPVPSLFTFNISGNWHQRLMGTVVEGVTVSLAGTKHKSHGAILLTHWGMSGPAILKLSSYAAPSCRK
ncbi:MAG: aminoacetone oxidase family FAD-binding enzyme [Prevotella sp.]|nr:aminoacetone oxidase family FAD-binding enzyme [Prevotella sp.]